MSVSFKPILIIAYLLVNTIIVEAQIVSFLVAGLGELETPFGKVPKEDLQMTSYFMDTSAVAVILLDNGFLSLEPAASSWECNLISFQRIKLLKKAAFEDFGKRIITTQGHEKLVSVKAQTINPDGTITPVKDFFNETDGALLHKKFVFPNLQEGSIIELEYKLKSKNIFELYPWYFQSKVPVHHSELVMDLPPMFEYMYFFKGQSPKTDLHTIRKKLVIDNTPVYDTIKYNRYYLDSLSAMRPERFVTTVDNYMSSVKFQLRYIRQLYQKPEKILHEWKDLAKELLENKKLGHQLNNRRNYDNIWRGVKPLLEKAVTKEEKIRAVYEYISKNVAWIEDDFSIFTDAPNLDEAFKRKRANSGELNMMLIASLNEAGIKATPLLVSTIEHGFPNKEYPMVKQFNHLICYVEDTEKPLFLDAGNIHRPMNLPRTSSLNGAGWVLDKNNPRWIDIPTPLSNTTVASHFILQKNGTLKGEMSLTYLGYAAMEERMRFEQDKNHEDFKKMWSKDFPDIIFDNITVLHTDTAYLPFKRMMNCSISDFAVLTDNLMYVKPILKMSFDENPFKQERRNYPVEFPFPIQDSLEINLTIPNNYNIEDLPKDLTLILPNDGAKFIYTCENVNDKIRIKIVININQLRYKVEEYDKIKSFFNQIVDKKQEQIVLKKK